MFISGIAQDRRLAVFHAKLLYDTSHWNVLRDRSDCHQMHRTVMSLFPDIQESCKDARRRYGVLSRVEEAYILVQSKIAPSGARLQAGYLIVETEDLAPIYAKIVNGMKLGFRLDANPSKRNWATGKIEGFVNPDEQIRWLVRRGKAAGFAIDGNGSPDVTVVPGRVIGRNPDGKITLVSASFEGQLRVVDADAFRQTLEEGLGNGKSYSLGLLCVKSLEA
jgi:CRISPR system Cascade subunit CasE